MLVKIKDNLPIIAAFLLIVSGIRLVVFYFWFGIDIFAYVELTEVLSLLFDYLAFAFIGAAIIGIYTAATVDRMYDNHIYKPLRAESILQKSLTDEQKKSREKRYKIYRRMFALVVLVVHIFLFRWSPVFVLFVTGFLGVTAGVVYSSFKAYKNFKQPDKNEFNTSLQINIASFAAIMLLIFYNILSASQDAYSLIAKKSVKRVTIEYKGKLVRTTRTYVYVGRTKNYMFFFNRQTGFSHVYPNSGIERVYLRKQEMYYDTTKNNQGYQVIVGGKDNVIMVQ